MACVGPAAVREWLAELAPAQQLRYVFVLCSDLVRASPPVDWVLQSLGACLHVTSSAAQSTVVLKQHHGLLATGQVSVRLHVILGGDIRTSGRPESEGPRAAAMQPRSGCPECAQADLNSCCVRLRLRIACRIIYLAA